MTNMSQQPKLLLPALRGQTGNPNRSVLIQSPANSTPKSETANMKSIEQENIDSENKATPTIVGPFPTDASPTSETTDPVADATTDTENTDYAEECPDSFSQQSAATFMMPQSELKAFSEILAKERAACLNEGEVDPTVIHVRSIIEHARTTSDSKLAAINLLSVSSALTEIGHIYHAKVVAKDALLKAVSADNQELIALTSEQLGIVQLTQALHNLSGNKRKHALNKARRNLTKAVEIGLKHGSFELARRSMSRLGLVHFHSGNHIKAIECCERALAIAKAHCGAYDIIAAQGNLAEAYGHGRRYRSARDAYLKASELIRSTNYPDPEFIANAEEQAEHFDALLNN
jgi:tetratricopeptide (TPR) repeat protein